MSLQLSTQVNGTPVLNFGSGAIPAGARVVAGCRLTEDAQIYAAVSGTVATYCQGLPFDSNGRLLAAFNSVATYSSGIPLDSSGFLCAGGVVVTTWSGGLPFDSDGALAGWNPQYLFADGTVDGYLYPIPIPGTAPNYTTAAGSTLVTAYGDPIGRMEDTSGNGVDATQSTAGSRPTAGGFPFGGSVRNLLTHTEDFDNAVWVKNSATITQDATTAPDGTAADKIIADAASGAHYAAQHLASVGVGYTVSCYMKAGEYDYGYFAGVGTFNAVFDLINGTVTETGGWANASITAVGDGWYLCSASVVAGSVGPFRFGVTDNSTEALFLGDGTSGIYIWGAQIVLGSALLPYQKVTAPYLVTQSGLPTVPAVYFDLTDDSVSLTLPAGTYTIVIPGNEAIHIEEGFVWAGGAFSIGPTTYTNGPANLFRDTTGRWLTGGFAIGRSLTASEISQVGRYYVARGCADNIVII